MVKSGEKTQRLKTGFRLPFLRKLPSSLGRFLLWWESRRNLRPVRDDCWVIRLGRLPKDFTKSGKISAIQLGESKAFELSSLDKKSIPPHLSVWVDVLTTPEQAYSFLPKDSPCRLVIRLKVAEICQTVGCSSDGTEHPGLLAVIWVHRMINTPNGQPSRDFRPGALGHAGITGLDEQSVSNKILRKDLRAQLAELASKDCYVLFRE
jgi:hypothetical protein